MPTRAERILSVKCGREVRAGDIAVCNVDLVLGTDASAPMAIDYFERMGGTALFDPSRVIFALDHYSPPLTARTAAFHDQVRAFARRHGADVYDVGEGISHQVVVERGLVRPDDLVIGADSHTVTCGALGAFATGVGSSDLAAAMLTGQIWLRVPAAIGVEITGARPAGMSAKDIALALVGDLGADGASYSALEFCGDALSALTLDDRLVLANLVVEAGAKAAMFPGRFEETRAGHDVPGVVSYARTVTIDLSQLSPRIARPHAPDYVRPLSEAIGTSVQMVFVGTCTGGRASDFRECLRVIDAAGGRLAPGLQLVLTPASREVVQALRADGTMGRFEMMGAIITTPGCGACCGTSGVIPGDDMTVLSTANRNFKGRMGNPTASIYLASPAACGAAAVAGRITDPNRAASNDRGVRTEDQG